MKNKYRILRSNAQAIMYIILIIGFSPALSAQDSLQQILKTNIPDSTRIDVLDNLFQVYISKDLDSSIYYAEEAIRLSRSTKDETRLGYMLKNMGIAYYYKGDFVRVLDYWMESLSTFQKIGHLKGESNLLGNIGAVYNSTGDYPKAIDYHLRCLRIAELNNDDFRRATALQNIGAVYSNMEEYEESAKYYNQAMELCASIDYEKCIGIVTMNLSEVYRSQNDIDKAEESIKKSKEIFTKLGDPSLPEAMIASAHLDVKLEKFDQAILEAKSAYELAKGNDSKVFMQRALVTLGQGYNGIQEYQEAKSTFQEATQLGENVGVNLDLQQAYEGLRDAYAGLYRYEEVVKVQDRLLDINKEVYDNDKNKNISNLQLSFNLEKKESEISLLNAEVSRANLQRNLFLATAGFLLLLAGGAIYQYIFVRRTNKIITEERNKADRLLLNILPEETAKELKLKGSVLPKKYDYATVLFTDFVGFTSEAANLDPEDLVHSVDYYFRHFDQIIERNNLEKIKTIGDAYMCVGGLPEENSTNAIDAIKAAQEMLEFVNETGNNPPEGIKPFKIRIGINSGPLVAGVVGTRKFQFDIWGDTVNVASRMETNCEPNQINVSENVFDILKDNVPFIFRGEIDVKNRGLMKMYYLDDVQVN
ncbi:MAG: tetratricopeptide repeat protein [Bacteroidia bacterium]|nr:tetratricopeptide repeat protein [Bacteroidia bacterium]